MVVWFAVLGVLGLRQVRRPSRRARGGQPGLRRRASSPTSRARRSSPSGRSSSSSPAARRCTPTWATSAGARSSCRGTRGSSRPRAQLLRPGGAAVGGPGGDREPVLPAGAGLGDHAVGDPGHDGHGDRVAGADLRRLLADGPGDPARLPPAPRRAAHVGRARRTDLRAARQLAADARLRRARARLPLVEHPRRRPTASP